MRNLLTSDELSCIFPNLPQVYELHGQFGLQAIGQIAEIFGVSSDSIYIIQM